MNNKKIRVGILGATGMVGQRFITLLENHPWFKIATLAASPQSVGKTYEEAVSGRWKMNNHIPERIRGLRMKAAEEDLEEIVGEVDLVFSALDMDPVRGREGTQRASASNGVDKQQLIREIEERYAAAGVAVVSNNSAHRWTEDVPMMIPEINCDHLKLIDIQRKNRGWLNARRASPDSAERNLGTGGFIVVKPNCSLQSYLPIIHALKAFGPKSVSVTTLQAISGAGKTFETWPEMVDNCIPFIKGEEEKTEQEPLKILGSISGGSVVLAVSPVISATCIRVAVADGHMASVSVQFEQTPSLQEIIDAVNNFQNPLVDLALPSAPKQFIKYFSEDDRPQTKLDRDYANGMGITCGRFRKDGQNGWKFISLSHNTIRGAAGGAILTAELLYKKGYIKHRQ